MRTTLVIGPAYLDRVIRVDRPLMENGVIDGSVDARNLSREGPLVIRDDRGHRIVIEGRPGLAEGLGMVEVSGRFNDDLPWSREVFATSDTLDLGGMGAGFAKALNGDLISAIGPDDVGRQVARLLDSHAIRHRPIRVASRQSDWTLIVSSGPHGDKLAIGFRGCHAAVQRLGEVGSEKPVDLLVVAGLPNRLAEEAAMWPAGVRFFAPAMRNMTDRDISFGSIAGKFDVISCNRREWRSAGTSEGLPDGTSLVAVTDGAEGCVLNYRDEVGTPATISLPAFPRDEPPRDTNRAGEAFAATLVSTLIDAGWTPGSMDEALVRSAGVRASAAAALVLDREDFGFPTAEEIESAVRAGKVAGVIDRLRR